MPTDKTIVEYVRKKYGLLMSRSLEDRFTKQPQDSFTKHVRRAFTREMMKNEL
jgi:hypothetical protein